MFWLITWHCLSDVRNVLTDASRPLPTMPSIGLGVFKKLYRRLVSIDSFILFLANLRGFSLQELGPNS